MSKETGGPAFPNVPDGAGDKWADWEQGMTLRDYFAIEALKVTSGASWSDLEYRPVNYVSNMENMALCAYQMADAMLIAGNK